LDQLAVDAVPGAMEVEGVPVNRLLAVTESAAASPLRNTGGQFTPEIRCGKNISAEYRSHTFKGCR